MTLPYHVLLGDCLGSLRAMPDCSVHTCITSPPYFGLRDYGHEGQIGLEATPEDYVARLVEVFREVRRVLRDDGTLWLNLGDSYAAARGGTHQPAETLAGGKGGKAEDGARVNRDRHDGYNPTRNAHAIGLKHKDLIGIPWRVAFALQADGWYLRQDIIWHKPNPMPESVTDRCTKAHEYLFLLSKSERYYFDQEAVKEQGVIPAGTKGGKASAERSSVLGVNSRPSEYKVYDGTRNRRSVWTVNTKPFKGAHFATFPPDLIEPCVLAGAPATCCANCGAPHERIIERAKPPVVGASDLDRYGTGNAGVHRKVGGQYQKWLNENPAQTVGFRPTCECEAASIPGMVLDPFGGSGTTAGVAVKHGRSATLCELNPAYVGIIHDRVSSIAGPLFAGAAE
jgi:DNA modification methylase